MGVLSVCHRWCDVWWNDHIYFRLSNDPRTQSRMRNAHIKINCWSSLLRYYHRRNLQIQQSYQNPNWYTFSSRNCTRSSRRENLSYYDVTSRFYLWTPNFSPLGNRFLRWDHSPSHDDL